MCPKQTGGKAFKELCELIQQHCKPAPSEIVQWFMFRKRVREQGETIADYLAALRELAADCNFGAELDSNLHDLLVCGVNNAKMQREMLHYRGLTLRKAISIARSQEETDNQVRELQTHKSAELENELQPEHSLWGETMVAREEINQATRPVHIQSHSRGKECYRCGSATHIT